MIFLNLAIHQGIIPKKYNNSLGGLSENDYNQLSEEIKIQAKAVCDTLFGKSK